jgi:hypothetical protein
MLTDKRFPTQCIRLKRVKQHKNNSKRRTLYPLDGGSTILRNVGNHSPNDMALHARIRESSCQVPFLLGIFKENTLKIYIIHTFIPHFALRQVHRLFQSQFLPAPGDTRSSQLHKMYQSRCTAKNSWWCAERLPETCRVVIPIKLELSASVGFIHKETVTMHGHTFLKCM